jgi:hypothetical protein
MVFKVLFEGEQNRQFKKVYIYIYIFFFYLKKKKKKKKKNSRCSFPGHSVGQYLFKVFIVYFHQISFNSQTV